MRVLKYFKNAHNLTDNGGDNEGKNEKYGNLVTEANITEEELLFIIDPINLRDKSPYSLSTRCLLFYRHFHDRRIKLHVLK